MKKPGLRTAALTLALAMLLTTGAFAANTTAADRLHALGLFQGTGSGYALDQTATRMQGLIMLIRLLGEESDALQCTTPSPFRDADTGTSARYAAYAYEKGYTTGTSADTFTPGATLSFRGYVTFLLRALGYQDKAGDFSIDTCLSKAAQVNLMEPATASAIGTGSPTLYRGDLAALSLSALAVTMRDGGGTLADKLIRCKVFTQSDAEAQGVPAAVTPYRRTVPADASTVSRTTKTYSLSTGRVTADVITVNTANPSVRVRTAMVNNRLGATAKFSAIAAASHAAVLVNGNFFDAYGTSKFPIGHVMVNGQFLYGVSGLTSFGFTSDGEIRVGRPAVFFYVEGDGCRWACYECNSRSQGSSLSVLYTPAYGSAVAITSPGTAVTVADGVIQSTRAVSAGSQVSIPAGGYVMYFGSGYTATDYYRAPTEGTAVTMTPRLTSADQNGFTLDNVVSMVSGGPRLVENGAVCTTLEPGFREARFTSSSTPRTAVGKLKNGKLVIVSTSAATIAQMRGLMMQLGCADAVNLDGGASTALAYRGSIVRTPGRALTTTLQVFVES